MAESGSASRKFLTYGVGNILQMSIRFLLLPIYLRVFAPEQYGTISTIHVVVSMLSLFAGVGVMNGLVRLYYEADEDRRARLVGTTWVWYFGTSFLVGVVLALAAGPLVPLLAQSGADPRVVRISALFFLFSVLQQVPLNIYRLDNRAGHYVAMSLITFFVDFGTKVLFVVVLDYGVAGYFASSAISRGVVVAVLIPLVLKRARIGFDAAIFGELFHLGLPYVFSGLAVWVLEVSDRLILKALTGAYAVGIYSLAYNFANVYTIVLAQPFGLFIDPYFFGQAAQRSEEQTRRLLVDVTKVLLVAGGAFYLALAGAGEGILRVFSARFQARTEYIEAVRLIPLVLLAPYLYMMSSPWTLAGLWIKRPKIASQVFVGAALVNVVLNFTLIPRFGAFGAAYATVAAYVAMVAVLAVTIGRLYPVGHRWPSYGFIATTLAIALFAGMAVNTKIPEVTMLVRPAVSVGLFGLVCLFVPGVLTHEEKRMLFELLRSVVRRGAKRSENEDEPVAT